MGLVSRPWVYQIFLPVRWLPPLYCPARTSPVLPWHHFDLILSLARGSIISHSLVSLGRLGGRQCNKLMEIEEGLFSLLSTLSHALCNIFMPQDVTLAGDLVRVAAWSGSCSSCFHHCLAADGHLHTTIFSSSI